MSDISLRASRAVLVAACLLAGIGSTTTFAAPAITATTSGSAADAASPGVNGMTVPLSTFMQENQHLRLRYTADEISMSIPLSPRLKVNSALLHLQLTNSISLIRERSQLAVRLNGRLLAQTALNPQQPETTLDVRLPANQLKPGYNRVTFSVAQHYTLRCEDPSAPELWTEIDPVSSTLNIQSELLPGAPRLSAMDTLFDPKLWGDAALTIVTATPMRDEQLQWGALVAEGAAIHLRYAPLMVTHAAAGAPVAAPSSANANFPGLQQATLRGSDLALVGTKSELAPYLSKKIQDAIAGGFLGVYPLDAAPGRFVMVVSGNSAEEVSMAAKAFTSMSFPFPDAASMLVSAVDYPKVASYAGKASLSQGGNYRFSQFDFKSTTVQGTANSSLINEENVQGLDLELSMPPDMFAHEDTNVDLLLHFAYGAGLRGDSVLNILLNGRFERAIALTERGGVVYNKYKISIPLRSFQPGLNRIRFMPRMMPLITGECQAIQTENLIMTMYDDSTIVLPNASHFVAMPNLRLLGRSGFPYTNKTDGADTLIQVAANDSKTVGAAWTILAKIAQRQGQPLQQALISFDLPQRDSRDLVVIGPSAHIQPDVLKGAPMEFAKLTRVPYPVASVSPAVEAPRDWVQRLLPGESRMLEVANAESDTGTSSTVTQSGGLAGDSLAMQYRSPFASGRTATIFTAADETTLQQGVGEIIKPAIWNDLQGNMVVWNKGASSVAWQKVGADYSVGHVSVPARAEFYFSRYPLVWIIALMLMTAILAFITTRLLKRHRRRHHPDAPVRREND